MPQSHEVPDWYRSTPGYQEMMAKEKAETLAHRRKLGVEIDELRKRQETELAPLRAAEEKAAKALSKAREPYEKALADHRQAAAARVGLARSLDAQVNQREGELLRSADPAIQKFITEMNALYEKLRHQGYTGLSNSRRDPVSGRLVGDAYSNKGSLLEVLAAIRAARTEAEGMKSRFVENLEAEFDRLRRTIPALKSAELVEA